MRDRATFISHFGAICCLLLPLFICGTLQVFAVNQTEFISGARELLLTPWAIALGVAVLLAIVGVCLPALLARRLEIIYLTLGFLLYIQGNLIARTYGVLDGSHIDWGQFRSEGVFDACLWGIGIILALFVFPRFYSVFKAIVPVFLTLQLVNIGWLLFQEPIRWNTEKKISQDKFFALSQDKNVIIILLDKFQSPKFENIVDNHPSELNSFRDFTFFRNASGSFTTTSPSIPAILSSEEYDNSEPLQTFLANKFQPKSLPHNLHAAGIQSHIASLPQLCPFLPSAYCTDIWSLDAKAPRTMRDQEILRLVDVSLFRFMPQMLKKIIYNDESWFFSQVKDAATGKPVPENHRAAVAFAYSFADQAKVSETTPVMKFIHLIVPHPPIVYKSNCTVRTGAVEKPLIEQMRCALKLANEIVDSLKRLEVYDKSLIFIISDHGSSGPSQKDLEIHGDIPDVTHAMPLFLVKRFGQKQNEMKVSNAPVALTDITATVLSELGIPSNTNGRSIYEVDENEIRERRYRHYTWVQKFWWKSHLPEMSEYIIRGAVKDPRNWQFHRKLKAVSYQK